MPTFNSVSIPTSLLESPSFQLERLRRRTREGVEAALQTQKTTLREYWVLTCLVAEAASSQSALSETLAIDASDMVRLLDSLESRNWVKRERDSKDRRRQIIASTKKGVKAHKELTVLVAKAEDEALDASTNKQLKHLRKLATAIIAADTPADTESSDA
ncbi:MULTISPECIES: MarR family winged helix-turn-helix transcriptional regulator [Corynebacterium]|uniref:MarR family transcriptional regulator n=1 Tax=Corynebacterium aurimucosum TaxID=169292 RepID=A0A558GGV4_9CORY|nr:MULTISPECIES: MarR family transcriptional regulator [Corynebacterium]MBU5654777.1 MarR family transcriptional regulator [Corynebacterium aurimucosum]MDK6813304.1 MarR family transcriptional regulator [Corynebacterium sp. UMB6689]OFN73689.1 MarR family transcriptional regulator [Corynebacterium sp. HMSC070E08]OFP21510.1 MarR family transcriptional regulator [Corynebacterium sp. HMSC066C02]OFS39367.1 MarR family transcriptional regulator [Corynebacterium sp. HMSC069E04]